MTPQQIQTTILSAQLKVANLTDANRVALIGGNVAVDWSVINLMTRYINACYRQYVMGDYISSNFLTCYDTLSALLGGYGTDTIDSNYQAPNITIITEGGYTPPQPFDFTEANLEDAGSGNWYLPIGLINGLTPVSVTSNGASFTFTYDTTGIFGFGGNYAQAIIVTVI